MKIRFTYRLAALLCAILSMVSCIYDEYADVAEGPGLLFRVRTLGGTKVSYDGFSTYFENGDNVGCVIAEKTGSGYTFKSNTKWMFQNNGVDNVLMLQSDDAYIRKIADTEKAGEGYVELSGELDAYSFFFYYPYVDAEPGDDFPKSGESFLVQQAGEGNWTDFPLFVNLDQTTKEKLNSSDFMWVGYTLDQKSGTNDITMDNANYPVNLEFLKKTSTIEVLCDAPISDVVLKTSISGDPIPVSRGCKINLSTGVMDAFTPATDDSNDTNESLQYQSQKLSSDQVIIPFDYGAGERYRYILPAQTNFSSTLSFTLNEKSYSANLSNLTVLEEGKLYIIYIASDDGSIIINDWMDGGYSDLEEILPGQIVVTEMTAERFKAGYTVTIRGEELGETASVRMSGASITEFTVNGDGTVLTFVIPDTAKDGQVILVSDSASESVAGEVTLVKPSEVALTPSSIKSGETLTITGNDLDLVKGVTFGGDVYVDVTSTETEISVTVPASAVTGNIMLELKNGTSIEGGVLTVLQPSVTSMTADRFKAGNVVTITGANLDMVKSVVLPGSGEVAMSSLTAETITFTLPELAQDGQIVLVNEQDGEIVSDKCVLTLVKPSEISYAPADLEAGQEMTISGADLDLVKSITFADGTTVEVTSTETQIVVTIPVSAVSGALTFNLKNGTQFNAPELTLIQPEVTSVSGKHKDGETITIVGTHFALVAKVKISGTEVGFTYDGNNTITFVVPDNTPDGDIILVTTMGAEVDGGDYVTVIPTNLATDPSSVKLGSSFNITGDDLDLVTAITLPGSGELSTSDWGYSDGKITVNALPETATDGKITLMTKCKDTNGAYKTTEVDLKVRSSSVLYEGNLDISKTKTLSSDDFNGVIPGSRLIVNISMPDGGNGKISFKYVVSESWEYIAQNNLGYHSGSIELTAELILSEDILTNIKNNDGIIIGGEKYDTRDILITKVYIEE